MRKSLLNLLIDPISKRPFSLEVSEQAENGRVITGQLRSDENRAFPIINGIPRFVCDQGQIAESFGFKWQQRNSYGSEAFQIWYRRWLMQRYGFANDQEMRGYFESRTSILEVGCGSGMSASISLSGEGRNQQWVGIDISSAIDLAQDRLGHLPNTDFLQADILQLPFCPESFDTVFAEGVLHHTPSTELALKSLVPLLKPKGEMLFYVYRKKSPVREFTDDYIRRIVSDLEPQKAWDMLRPLTKLGKVLAELHLDVDVPEDIPYLGIKAGRHDIQRLIYWHFAKLFWNEAWSDEENNHVNFDWYHPHYAHRHTEEEIRRWCAESNLSISRFDVEESGSTVRAIKE